MPEDSPDMGTDFTEVARPSDSRSESGDLADRFGLWLTGIVGADARPEVGETSVPTAAGMSSDTVMVDAAWTSDGTRNNHRLVLRMAPGEDAMPVFPSYDLALQAAVMRAVRERTAVPVPRVYRYESSVEPLGREFLVMERVDGDIPPDVMPYNFGSWVSEASPEQRLRLQESSVEVLAQLHAMADPEEVLCAAAGPAEVAAPVVPADAGGALREHLQGQRRYYEWASDGGPRSPLIERAFDVLESTSPAVAGPPVLCWGDSRIGNIVFRDFRPAGVLDWEMAALGPREMDLGWTIFLHRFFEDLAAQAGLPGLPEMLRRSDVVAQYERSTGHTVRDLEWFVTYAALRQAVIMYRIQRRTIAFGQAEQPGDPDSMIMHRKGLEEMLDGVYWPALAEAGL
ncbi:phosphotransferase family protein [Tomitella fengzijianii]|uniref:Phosphotransferase family protein n=1 Tax=Tomitella fengzijianii TaxID=2597660 RepID=A0A516X0E4_9ACTN|nr:phosphotransferase family protein [Tomitella fengzijianii]QDQ96523.1 phosphotransferase family protein [Tomitella fengzijianii]